MFEVRVFSSLFFWSYDNTLFIKQNETALYHSPDIVRTVKSIRLKWAGHVARTKETKSTFKPTVKRS